MANLLEKTGKIVFLRAHDPGTGFGPPSDSLDVEAVFCLNAIADGAFGFQLRNDNNLPARQAMFSLLRDAFVNNLPVTADFLIDPGKKNGTAIRIALIKTQTLPVPPVVTGPPVVLGPAASGKVIPASGAGGNADTKAKAKSRKAK